MIRTLVSLIQTFTLALWLGGLVWLFVSVTRLFKLDHDIAIRIAPAFFDAFNRYQLLLATLACATSISALLMEGRQRSRTFTCACAFSALLLAVAIAIITHRMEAIRQIGESGGADFKRLHGLSMVFYLATTVLVAIALGAATYQQSQTTSRGSDRLDRLPD